LHDSGHWREHIMLRILGRANQGWDAEGLSRLERSERHDDESRMLRALLGGRLHVIDRAAGVTSAGFLGTF
jgi:hypothetical protein